MAQNQNELLANILAESKLNEKRAAQAAEKQTAVENAIKDALRAGDRARAEKLALSLVEVRQKREQHEQLAAQAKRDFEAAKGKIKQLETTGKNLERVDKTAQAMDKIGKSMGMLGDAEDLLKKIEEQQAMTEAKLEIAMQDAEIEAAHTLDEPPEIKQAGAEDILREFEEG